MSVGFAPVRAQTTEPELGGDLGGRGRGTLLLEALTAKYWTPLGGLEWNGGFLTALGTTRPGFHLRISPGGGNT
jgi:hypothetical protein